MKVSAVTPRLLLTPDVDQRLRHWTDIAAGEFSCLGLADQTEEGFLISEVFLLKQSCSASETELDQSAVAALLAELDKAGVDVGRVRAWIHSHATFNVFWSGTDARTIEALATGEWLASLVVNKAGSKLARLDIRAPVSVTLDEVPVDTIHDDLGLRAECELQFREQVTEVLMPALIARGAPSPTERRLMLEGRIGRARHHGLDWDDLNDLLGPEMGDRRLDVGL